MLAFAPSGLGGISYGIAYVGYKHVQVVQSADDDCIGLHEEVFGREYNKSVDICHGFREEILNWLENRHVNLHLNVVKEVALKLLAGARQVSGIRPTMSEKISRFWIVACGRAKLNGTRKKMPKRRCRTQMTLNEC